jgi:hypothetical protein
MPSLAVSADLGGVSSIEVTFVTVADQKYFLGAVALANSLRLTGNPGRILVIDAGLRPAQRERLSITCDVQELPLADGPHPNLFKPSAYLLGLTGVVVFIDSDVIITSRLKPILDEAARGVICAFVDGPVRERRLSEWIRLLGLRNALRDQPHVNAGFVALEAGAWDTLLRRWLELSTFVQEQIPLVPFDPDDPFALMDQDVLNALLMSEVPMEALHFLDWELAASPQHASSTRIAERTTLACTNEDRATILLHYWDHPKPWLPGALGSLHFPAYVDLLARVLASDDAPIQVDPSDLPAWLRGGLTGRIIRRAPGVRRALTPRPRAAVKTALSLLPPPIEKMGVDLGKALLRKSRVR